MDLFTGIYDAYLKANLFKLTDEDPLHTPPSLFEPSHEKQQQHFAYAKTKAQISFTVTANLICTFIFATWIVRLLSNSKIFKLLAIFCACAAWFVSNLSGNHNVVFFITQFI